MWAPPPPAWALPPPPPRPVRWGRLVSGTLIVLLVCCFGAAGTAIGYGGVVGLFDAKPRWIGGQASNEKPPPADASLTDWRLWVFRAAGDILAARAKAITAGDETAFTGPIDPTNTKLLTEEKRRFTVLRQMGVGAYRESATGVPDELGTRSWRLDTEMFYCFGPPSCSTVRLPTRTEWTLKDNKLRISAVAPSEADWNGPRPWEIDDLQVRTGQRVVLAATKSNAWRLADAVKAADQAAKVADTFGKWHTPPGRFVIFLAGPTEWKKWYGHEQPNWAAAWAVPVGNFTTEVVVRTDSVRQSSLQGLLTHELTHVTSLAGERDGSSVTAWWLVEGIADYAQWLGRPIREYDALIPTRAFVRGDWDGFVAIEPPGTGAAIDTAAAHYGVAFLAVRRIAERFGQDKMLSFFGAVVHDGHSLSDAAPATLGVTWANVQADCAKFVRTSAG